MRYDPVESFRKVIASNANMVYNASITMCMEGISMKHIQVIQKACLKQSLAHGGCGECQSSCQSACKTSCTVANQSCANKENNAVLNGAEGKINRTFGK